MRLVIKCFAISIGLLCPFLGSADTYSFGTLPANGKISGTPGSTIGWGYTLANDSATDWLVVTNLNTDTFLYGVPEFVFDFPILGPAGFVSVDFDPVLGAGLLGLTFDSTAPVNFIDSGSFDLSAEWWSGDPTSGGSYIADAPDALRAYSAQVTVQTPECTSAGLLLGGITLIATMGILRKCRAIF